MRKAVKKEERRRCGEGSRKGGGRKLEFQLVKGNCRGEAVDKGKGKRPMLFLGKSSVSRVIIIHTVDIKFIFSASNSFTNSLTHISSPLR